MIIIYQSNDSKDELEESPPIGQPRKQEQSTQRSRKTERSQSNAVSIKPSFGKRSQRTNTLISSRSIHKKQKESTFESVISETSRQPSLGKNLLQEGKTTNQNKKILKNSYYEKTQQQLGGKSQNTLRLLNNLQHKGPGNSMAECENESNSSNEQKNNYNDYQRRKSNYLMLNFKPKNLAFQSRTDLATQGKQLGRHKNIQTPKYQIRAFNSSNNIQVQQQQQQQQQQQLQQLDYIEDPLQNEYQHQNNDMECVRNFDKYFPQHNIDNIAKLINEKRRKKMLDQIQKSNKQQNLSMQQRFALLAMQKMDPSSQKKKPSFQEYSSSLIKIGSINLDQKVRNKPKWRPSSIYFESKLKEEEPDDFQDNKKNYKAKSQFEN